MKWCVGIALASSLIAIPTVAPAQSPIDTTAQIQQAANNWMKAYNTKCDDHRQNVHRRRDLF